MPTTDSARLVRQKNQPRVLQLWRALRALKSCVSFMNSGAHPDDETSAMLAALHLRDGLSISYVCATRGEGGQNDIGTENTFDLGVLRTAEMERAADTLNLRLYWLSESPDDTIFDFGFSKSGADTLATWGGARTLQRFVEVVRTERPDILCPTFLDIPGQHGHHRAMTQIAFAVMASAADVEFLGVDLPVWQVKKLYLPAWSGAGDAYDDDVPPPHMTLSIEAQGEDPVSGWSFEQIGQHSRVSHRTQAMGRWISPGQERNWPLHLAESHVEGPDDSITAGLPATLAELAQFASADVLAESLASAQQAIDSAIAAFPDLDKCRRFSQRALKSIRKAQSDCPDSAKIEVMHRLTIKEIQLSEVIRLGSRVAVRGWLEADILRPGDTTTLQIESTNGDADEVTVTPILPTGWSIADGQITLKHCTACSDPYPSMYRPGDSALPALRVTIRVNGQTSRTTLPLEIAPIVLPLSSARLSPDQVLVNLATPSRNIEVGLSARYPEKSKASLCSPDGWKISTDNARFVVTPPDGLTAGVYRLPLLLDGDPARTVTVVEHPHVSPRARVETAQVKLRVLHAVLPDVRIGYVGGGHDRVAEQLRALGFEVHLISDADLLNPMGLSFLDTLIVGIFAMRTRPMLLRSLSRIHQWIEEGGNLLSLYHRPWDNWDPLTVPPRPIIIGKPSLRWRVTDENSVVTHLLPEHPLLNTPNYITDDDWHGWHKERGLYFAKSWDSAYAALLSMADPHEQPHQGALLSARIGNGRHTHTSLILHHQMEKLVPGAYRLMANLVARPE